VASPEQETLVIGEEANSVNTCNTDKWASNTLVKAAELYMKRRMKNRSHAVLKNKRANSLVKTKPKISK